MQKKQEQSEDKPLYEPLEQLTKDRNLDVKAWQDKSIRLESPFADHVVWAYQHIYRIPYPQDKYTFHLNATLPKQNHTVLSKNFHCFLVKDGKNNPALKYSATH